MPNKTLAQWCRDPRCKVATGTFTGRVNRGWKAERALTDPPLQRYTGKSAAKRPSKPSKPYRDFPLFAHATGRWAKKIRGKLHYFGKWDDAQGALQKYLDTKDDLYAGRTPRGKNGRGDELTVAALCNRFLTRKHHAMENGEIVYRTFHELKATTDRIIRVFGRTRLVEDLAPEDFGLLRRDISKTCGPTRLTGEITRTKAVFKYTAKNELIAKSVRYGSEFDPPTKSVIRKHRASNGSRMFEAPEIRDMLDIACPQMRAMILLGVNCGYGNHDCGTLARSNVDLDRGWVHFPRPKTGIERRCPLWPETVAALRAVIANRPAPQNDADEDLVFITATGHRWHLDYTDTVGVHMKRLLDLLGINRPGVRFYGLRHSFRTIADATRDFPAVRLIMGHVDSSIDDFYRERVDDERLEAVTVHVRTWLFSDVGKE